MHLQQSRAKKLQTPADAKLIFAIQGHNDHHLGKSQHPFSQICDYSPVFIILNKLEHVVGFGIQLLLLALERLKLPLQAGDVGLEEAVDVPALLRARALLLQKFPLGQECLILPLQTLHLEGKADPGAACLQSASLPRSQAGRARGVRLERRRERRY